MVGRLPVTCQRRCTRLTGRARAGVTCAYTRETLPLAGSRLPASDLNGGPTPQFFAPVLLFPAKVAAYRGVLRVGRSIVIVGAVFWYPSPRGSQGYAT